MKTPRWHNPQKHLSQPKRTRRMDGCTVQLRGVYSWFRTEYLRSAYNEALLNGERLATETLPQYLRRHGMTHRIQQQS